MESCHALRHHKTIRLTIISLIATGSVCLLLGCRSTPGHPPAFADFHRVGPGTMNDEKKLQAYVTLFTAARFTRKEAKLILATGSARELAGAALCLTVGDGSVPVLIGEAIRRGSNDPVVWTAVASCVLRETRNSVHPGAEFPKEEHVLSMLERLEPENGLAACLRANLQIREGDTNAARLSLRSAAEKPVLYLHASELRESVERAALKAKYPRYTAAVLAVATLGPGSDLTLVAKRILTGTNVDRATAEACFELGRRHEAQAKLMVDQLMALSVQKRALELLQAPQENDELRRIEKVKSRIRKANDFLDSPSAHELSEREWIAWFQKAFSKGELEAATELAAKLNYQL